MQTAALTWTVLLAFAWTGAVKSARPNAFRDTVASIMRRPVDRSVRVAATAVCGLELAVPLCGILGRPRAGLILADVLLLGFGAFAWRMRHRGISCTCFGAEGSSLGFASVIRNAFLVAVSVPPLIAADVAAPTVEDFVAAVIGVATLIMFDLWAGLAEPHRRDQPARS